MGYPLPRLLQTAERESYLMTLRKEQNSAAIFGLVHSRYKRDVRLVVYRQLYSADSSVLPSVNRPETLPFT